MARKHLEQRHESGLTLIEVVVATAIFTVVSLAASHLLVWAVRTLWTTRAEAAALAAAQAKMEELQALAWRFDDTGNRISDRDTNLAANLAPSGGPGLSAAPPDTLSDDVPGYVDYLDEHGRWLSGGGSPPGSAAFVRRWSVRPFAPAPEDTLVLQVLVLPLATPHTGRALPPGRVPGGSALTSARTRVR